MNRGHPYNLSADLRTESEELLGAFRRVNRVIGPCNNHMFNVVGRVSSREATSYSTSEVPLLLCAYPRGFLVQPL